MCTPSLESKEKGHKVNIRSVDVTDLQDTALKHFHAVEDQGKVTRSQMEWSKGGVNSSG
jgi:hypothetical protein